MSGTEFKRILLSFRGVQVRDLSSEESEEMDTRWASKVFQQPLHPAGALRATF